MAGDREKMPFEVPPEMRDFAGKSLDQARKAVDTFISAAEKAASGAEQSADAVRSGARDMARHTASCASQNLSATFAMMEQLLQARGMDEVMRIQAEFMRTQMQAFQQQAKGYGEALQKAGGQAKSAAAKSPTAKPTATDR